MGIMQQTIRQSIMQYSNDGVFCNKKIVLFGQGQNTGYIMNELEERGLSLYSIFDNDKRKQNTTFWGVPVVVPMKYEDENITFLIASGYERQMREQLCQLGYTSDCIYCLASFRNLNWLEKDAEQSLLTYEIGEKVYKELRTKYVEEEILLFPSESLGDAYLPTMFLKKYAEGKDIVCVVGTEGTRKVVAGAELCDVVKINAYEMLGLQKYFVVNGEAALHMKYIHPRFREGWQVGIGHEMISSSKYAYWESYGPIVFDLGRYPEEGEHIRYRCDLTAVERIFSDNNLKEGKTVLLVPFTNSMAEIPYGLWNDIAKYLVQRGYTVCTNVSGAHEKAIEGTVAVCCELKDMQTFVEKAGYAVMSRCGLCDMLGGTKAKKIVLYSEFNLRFCTYIENNDLRKGKIDTEAVQIVIENSKADEAFSVVKEAIGHWKEER